MTSSSSASSAAVGAICSSASAQAREASSEKGKGRRSAAACCSDEDDAEEEAEEAEEEGLLPLDRTEEAEEGGGGGGGSSLPCSGSSSWCRAWGRGRHRSRARTLMMDTLIGGGGAEPAEMRETGFNRVKWQICRPDKMACSSCSGKGLSLPINGRPCL